MLLPGTFHIQMNTLADLKGGAGDGDCLVVIITDGKEDAIPVVRREVYF